MSDAPVWPAKCRHLAKPGAVALEPYAVVTLKNVPAWQNKLHLELDFECTLCPLCAAALTCSVVELAKERDRGPVDLYCEGCDAQAAAPMMPPRPRPP